MRRSIKNNLVTPAISLLLLCGVAVETFSRPRPGDTEPYHARIRQMASRIPLNIGPWSGRDIPPRQEAITLLKPNVIMERVFTDMRNRQIYVLLVHCKDARDIDGHYPPICYPANGRPERSEARRADTWIVAGQNIPGTYYEFKAGQFTAGANKADSEVYNFIVLPGRIENGQTAPGQIVRDMGPVKKQAWDYLRRFYGAAQFQVVFSDPTINESEQLSIFQQIVRAYMPVIEAIRIGALQ